MPRSQRTYDHRLVRLVQDTGDITIATGVGVPRSTAAGWLRQAKREVTTVPTCETSSSDLRARLARMEARLRRCQALLRVLLAVLRIMQPDFTRLRVPLGADKARLLRAVDRARGVVRLPRLLRLIGLSPSRLAAWRRAAIGCQLDDTPSCPHGTPHRLAHEEIVHIRDMVTSPEWRHVPVGRLAILAQRLGRVFASASTWHRLVRERGWRRPRLRLHPQAPREGIRADAPNGLWHIDTTVIRLLDGTKAFAQAVIDNFSRRILAWRVTDRIDAGTSVELLLEAGTHLPTDRRHADRLGGPRRRELQPRRGRPHRAGPPTPRPGAGRDHVLQLADRGVVALAQTRLAVPAPAGLPDPGATPRRLLRRAAQRAHAAQRLPGPDA